MRLPQPARLSTKTPARTLSPAEKFPGDAVLIESKRKTMADLVRGLSENRFQELLKTRYEIGSIEIHATKAGGRRHPRSQSVVL